MKLLVLLSLAAFASVAQPRAQGHAFFGIDDIGDSRESHYSVGAGADVFVYKGLAVSPGAAYVYGNGVNAALLNLNGSYHFLRGKGKLQPFVSGGYGAATTFTEGINMINYGGGANYWFHRRFGVRGEILNFQAGSDRILTSFRFGVSFR